MKSAIALFIFVLLSVYRKRFLYFYLTKWLETWYNNGDKKVWRIDT